MARCALSNLEGGFSSGLTTSRVIRGDGLSWPMDCCPITGVVPSSVTWGGSLGRSQVPFTAHCRIRVIRCVSYFRTQEEMAHTCRGTINLAAAFIDTIDSTNFMITNGPSQVYHLRALNEVERQRWVTALELAKAKAIKKLDSGVCRWGKVLASLD